MEKLTVPAMLVFLCMAAPAVAPAVAQDVKGTSEGTTKDFEATDEFKGMAQEQKLLHVEDASDLDAREQETRKTIREKYGPIIAALRSDPTIHDLQVRQSGVAPDLSAVTRAPLAAAVEA